MYIIQWDDNHIGFEAITEAETKLLVKVKKILEKHNVPLDKKDSNDYLIIKED